MGSLRIDDFKKSLQFGGARPSLFEIEWRGATQKSLFFGQADREALLVKGTSLPASIIQPIPVPFRGRQLPVAGDRIFEPWNITVINDNDFGVRKGFEDWMHKIAHHVDGETTDEYLAPNEYMADMAVHQLDRTGDRVYSYLFTGVWPSSVAPIELSYDAENQIEQFDVQLQVTYWESLSATSGYIAGRGVDGDYAGNPASVTS